MEKTAGAQSKKIRRRNQINYYLMSAPGMLWLILFSIVPMFGVVMAFQDFNPGLGIFRSHFIGLENFEYLFSMKESMRVIRNTLIIAGCKIVLNLLIPLTFALLLNEIRSDHYKRTIQTIAYLPHFLSWVILASIIINIFGYDGIANKIAGIFGAEARIWMGESTTFRALVIGTDVWKEFGFNAVIYLAALTGINPQLYEAAAIDGASKWKATWRITIPGLMNTVVLLLVLSLGNILNAGFDQVYNMYNPMVYSTGDIIDTWVYRIGLFKLQFSLATTAGLFKSVISFLLISVSYLLAYRYADYTIF